MCSGEESQYAAKSRRVGLATRLGCSQVLTWLNLVGQSKVFQSISQVGVSLSIGCSASESADEAAAARSKVTKQDPSRLLFFFFFPFLSRWRLLVLAKSLLASSRHLLCSLATGALPLSTCLACLGVLLSRALAQHTQT